MHLFRKPHRAALLKSASCAAIAAAATVAAPASAIVINDNYTPAQVVDPNNITGVGQMVVDQQNGFITLCTATLINPRTVIFSAHCVNENSSETAFKPSNSYGAKFGGTPISFGFTNYTLPGIRGWIRPGPNQYKTNTANAYYNSNYVTYNPASTQLGVGLNFLQGDVAMAALDTPASTIPQWTLLFSPLPTPPEPAGPAGTGYHVTIEGYGTNGIGTTGATGGIDFRRRVAENMIGILGSLDDQDNFLFGQPDGLPQNLYQIDFDDPKRGTPAANPYDFNVFRDNATQKEGTVGPGDSGGPLVLDQTYSKPIVIGVLSGSDRFFLSQPPSSYGTTAFYQPLYLFWDWIVANNPYKYVSAQAGDGKWNDPNHWAMNLDPAYQVLGANGQPTNGLPTTPAAGVSGAQPKWGQVCYQDPTINDCYDLATGKETINHNPEGQSGTGSAAGVASGSGASSNITGGGVLKVAAPVSDSTQLADLAVASSSGSAASGAASGSGAAHGLQGSLLSADGAGSAVSGSILSSDAATPQVSSAAQTTAAPTGSTLTADQSSDASGGIPAPTAANGLPGATGFVPNDTDGNPATNAPARYYDVTLSADGTTTLDSGFYTIDRLTISGANAGLSIAAGNGLTTLIDTTQTAGTMTVDGTYWSQGDYALIGGMLQGSGSVSAPYLTSVMGAIAPGRLGTIGTLTVNGNVVLASGSRLYMDIGPNGTSDRLTVNPVSIAPDQVNPATIYPGIASLGGLLAVSPVAGYRPRFGDSFLLITAAGGVQGGFNAVSSLSAILYPQVSYSANAVNITIQARPYLSVVNTASPVQVAYAGQLDQGRAHYAQMSTLYGELDYLDLPTLEATLESMAPHPQVTSGSIARMQSDALSRLFQDRLDDARSNSGSSGFAVIGNPLQLAELQQDNPGAARTMTDATAPAPPPPRIDLPDGVSAFIAGGYLTGDAAPLPSAISAGHRDELDGWYLALGGEVEVSPHASLGASLAYSHGNGRLLSVSQAHNDLTELALYGTWTAPAGFFINGQLNAGALRMTTKRMFVAGTTPYVLTSSDTSPEFSAEANVGKAIPMSATGHGLVLTPLAGLRYEHIQIGPMAEQGGDAALLYNGRNLDSLEGRLGLDLKGSWTSGAWTVVPNLKAAYVHDFDHKAFNIEAMFFEGLPPVAFFPGPKPSQDWGELGGGLTFHGPRVDVKIGAQTNFGRKDLSYQTYSAALTVHF